MGRKRRIVRNPHHEDAPEPCAAGAPAACWLCCRPLGGRIEWHHPHPKSRGGRETVAVHPICHRAIHASFTNKELARFAQADRRLGERPELSRFLGWIANKPPDFSAPTRKRR